MDNNEFSEFGRNKDQIETGVALLLGEIKGQMRELIHSTNNMAMKFDGLALRVAALEASEQRRVGVNSVFAQALNSRSLGWIVGGLTTGWLYISGRLTL